MPDTAPTADLAGWTRSPFTHGGATHDCYERGGGPGVVLIPEVPGVSPEVLALGDLLVDNGFTVVIPSLFGAPGRAPTTGYVVKTVARLCVSAEFRAFATNARRPVTDFLRAVAADLDGRTPGHGVGVVGMCFTGGFALAAAFDESVVASVVSQPGVPFPIGRARQADPGMSVPEFDRVAERADAGEVCALGLRFREDSVVPRARFDTIKRRLGDAFEVIELDSRPGNADAYTQSAHSVLTHEVRDQPPNSAYRARARVLAFLQERLTPGPAGTEAAGAGRCA